MTNKIRWGLLSTANINQALIPAIRQSKRGELVAVASRSLDNAKAYAKKWEIPRAIGSYQEMLDSGAIDAVYIGLPNHLHAPWSIKSLMAGVHVLCEKPFALTLDEVDAVAAASKESGCVSAEAFMYRHHPQTKIVGDFLKSGRLGEISALRGIFNFAMSDERRLAPDVRLVPEWGGGALWDVGVYPLSYSQFVMGGPPEWVFGSQWIGPHGVDETFCGQMGYPGGRIAQISCGFRSPFHTHVEIIGSQGWLEITRPFVTMETDRRLTFFDSSGNAEEIPVPEKYLYLGEVEDMHAAILDGTPNHLTLEETRNHVKTALALYESAKSGKVVALD